MTPGPCSRALLVVSCVALSVACGEKKKEPAVAMNGVLPAKVGGVTLEIQTFAGTEIADPGSAAW